MTDTAMPEILFHVPAVPVAQPRQRVAVIAGHATTYTPTKAPVNAFKATCRHAASLSHAGAPLADAIRLSLIFVMPRPKAMMWKTRSMPRVPHTKKPDIDNLVKSVKDALTGLIWRDDSQVHELRAVKVVAAGDEQPHVEVVIW